MSFFNKVTNHNCVQILAFCRFHLITDDQYIVSLYIESMDLSAEFAKLVWLYCSLLSKKKI